MPIFLLLIALKVTITGLVLIVTAMFAAELLPQMGAWAVDTANGTWAEPAAVYFAKAMNFLGHLAGQFLEFMYKMLNAIGIDATSLKDAAKGGKTLDIGGDGPSVNEPPSSDDKF